MFSFAYILVISLLIAHEQYVAASSTYMVASFPFDEASGGKKFGIMQWSNNTISPTGESFQLDKVNEGVVVFFGDNGKYGLIASDRGKVGIFGLQDDGKANVIDADYRPKNCYANNVVVDPTNVNRAYVVDVNVNGGICGLRIDSTTSEVTDEGLIIPFTSPLTMLFPTTNDSKDMSGFVVVVSLSGVASVLNLATNEIKKTLLIFGTANRDGTPDALVSDAVLTADNQYLLVLDNNAITGTMRLSVVAMNWQDGSMKAVQVINKLSDPCAIIASPFNNAAVIASAQGNALIQLKYDPTANVTNPITVIGSIATTSKSQLPSAFVAIQGTDGIMGRIAVAELSGIRQIQFTVDGSIIDLGLNACGPDDDDSGSIVGAIGAKPSYA